MKKRLSLALAALLTLSSLRAQLRAPTPEEKKALDKAVTAIVHTLDGFNGEDWEKLQDYYSGEVAVNSSASVPMDIDNNFERQYNVVTRSGRHATLIQPLDDKLTLAMQKGDIQQAQAIGKQIKALSWLTVDVYINRNAVTLDLQDKETIKVTVKGIPTVYKFRNDQNDGSACWLLFGNWTTARHTDDGLNFKFTHAKVTPYIENIAILIHGADDRLQQLLETIDWSQVQNALTL